MDQVQGQLTQINQAVSQASTLYSNLDSRIASDRSAADDSFAEMEASGNELRSGMKEILSVLSATSGPVAGIVCQHVLEESWQAPQEAAAGVGPYNQVERARPAPFHSLGTIGLEN